jgi:hypothetical protein
MLPEYVMGRFVADWSDTNRHSPTSLGVGEYQEHIVVKTKLSLQRAVRASFGVMSTQEEHPNLLRYFLNER